MDKELLDAIRYICSVDEETYVISVLADSLSRKHLNLTKKLTDREKSLKTICKLNRKLYHNDAINALSDVDSYDED